MKKRILLIFVMILLAGKIFAGSVITQRVVNACGFVKGLTTLNLNGQMNDTAMQSISSGNSMMIYNSLDSYLVFPTLFPRTKTGFGAKTAARNVSVNTKNGKFKWTEKDLTPYFTFVTGEERIQPVRAVLKSKGTIDTPVIAELESKKLTIFDKLCSEQGLRYLASLALIPEAKGNNYKISYNDGGIQAKVSVDSKRKITAKYALSPEVAYPALLESEYVFTNKYDYSLVIVGEGDVNSGFVGSDQVEFRVTDNNDKFRYFAYNGTKVTNDFMTLELEEDTEVQAVFGTYDLSLKITGNGSASAEFIGSDEAEVKVTENKGKFRYFTVNGERRTGSEMTLALEEDTIVEAVFGNYDLSVTVSGKGSVSCEFIGSEEVVVTAFPGEEFFSSFEWDGNISYENPLKLTLTKDTELLAIFKEGKKYVVIDISGGSSAENYPISWLDDVPEGGWTEEYKTTKLVLRKIEPGSFTMGSPEDELGRYSDETQHEVTLTNAYYIGVFETTQKQYELIMRRNPDCYKGAARPVQGVSYDMLRGNGKGAAWPASYNVDETSFFGILRAKTQMTFDLPTEAQWEFACRAGTTTALNSGKNLSDEEQCDEMAKVGRYWFNVNDGKGGYSEHTTVGSYFPNAWGLYDMHGNAWEWCLDWYASYDGDATDPKGGEEGVYRVLRGGSWGNGANRCRSAYRNGYDSDSAGSGFRIALVQNVFSGPDNQIQKDFEFEIESRTENTMPIFQTKFYGKLKDGTEKLLEDMGRLEYDGASGIVAGVGKHKTTWIPDATYIDIMYEVELRVEYEDVTEQATYLVLDTTSNKMRVSPGGPDITDDKCRMDELWLRRIEPGTLIMGSPSKELGHDDNETQHQVTLTKAYYIGVFEMTQRQFENIMGANSSFYNYKYKGEVRPVEGVPYNKLRRTKNVFVSFANNEVDENSFMGQLRKKAGNIFDLPTEAQWEYACRAGTTASLNSGKNISNRVQCDEMAEVGRYYGNRYDGKGGYNEHTKVGSYLPNAWGLYDMHGNVWEWCFDGYKTNLGSCSVTDPRGFGGTFHVLRGGSWENDAYRCRSAYRYNGYRPDDEIPSFGFRIALVQNVFYDHKIKRDFEFEIESGTENTLPIFQIKFYGKLKNGTKKLLEKMGRLEYDGASGIVAGIGKHKLTWIPDVAYTNIMDEVELRVEYEDVTEQANYLVLDTTSNKMRVSTDAPDTTDDKCRTDELWLKRIEPGTFTMGSPKDELDRNDDETLHKVTLTKAYYIGVFETTQKQFRNISGVYPSYYEGDMRPVEGVSYGMLRGTDNGSAWPTNNEVDENSFMGQLKKKAGNIFDLPTEAQWEFACRAGNTMALNSGTNLSDIWIDENMKKLGRYNDNKDDGKGGYSQHTTVGSYLPNAWGLYDMLGNVWEWCLDWYASYDKDATDPKGGEEGYRRVLRGGSWRESASNCRRANRHTGDPNDDSNGVGFRIVLVQ